MAITEEKRHKLYVAAEEILGTEEANALMELLPPVGWADVATKQDLALLRSDLDALEERMGLRLDVRISDLRAELHRGLRVQFGGVVAANAAMLGIAVAVARLIS